MTDLEAVVINSQRLARTTKRQYALVVRDFVAFAGEASSNWSPATVDAWFRQLDVKPISRNAYLAAIKYAARRWAALNRTFDFAAAAENALVPVDKHARVRAPLDEDQLGALVGTCTRSEDPMALRDRAILAIAIATGLRRAEIASIAFEDLDGASRSIVVVAKRNKRHRVCVSAPCWLRIDAWLGWLRRRHVPTTGPGRLFRSLRRCLDAELGHCVGPSMSPEAIYAVIRRRARQAGIKISVSPHSLRHSLVAQLRARGVSEDEIARRVGHADPSTTAGYGGERVTEPVEGLPT